MITVYDSYDAARKRPSVDRLAEAHGEQRSPLPLTTITSKAATEVESPAHVAVWPFLRAGTRFALSSYRSCTRGAPMQCCNPTLHTSKPGPLVCNTRGHRRRGSSPAHPQLEKGQRCLDSRSCIRTVKRPVQLSGCDLEPPPLPNTFLRERGIDFSDGPQVRARHRCCPRYHGSVRQSLIIALTSSSE